MRNKTGDDVAASLSTTPRGPIEQHRYSAGVISFVIGERTRGVTWRKIGESVKTRFGAKPTERQMRTWWKKYGVSMEADSISRVISLKLDEVEEAIAA